nr:hypothetical protein Iba_chr10eCG10160 [Ipomoea batatas]
MSRLHWWWLRCRHFSSTKFNAGGPCSFLLLLLRRFKCGNFSSATLMKDWCISSLAPFLSASTGASPPPPPFPELETASVEQPGLVQSSYLSLNQLRCS